MPSVIGTRASSKQQLSNLSAASEHAWPLSADALSRYDYRQATLTGRTRPAQTANAPAGRITAELLIPLQNAAKTGNKSAPIPAER
jgi:hypothetical protein